MPVRNEAGRGFERDFAIEPQADFGVGFGLERDQVDAAVVDLGATPAVELGGDEQREGDFARREAPQVVDSHRAGSFRARPASAR